MPARFRFDLAPLLELRERTEDEKRCTFEQCRAALDARTSEIERAGALRVRTADELAAVSRARNVAHARFYDECLRGLDRAIECSRQRRDESARACERARDELLAARRERRAIEMLQERRLRRFEADERRREELEIDEGNARRRFARASL